MSIAQDLLWLMTHGGLWILGLGLITWALYAAARRAERKRRHDFEDTHHW